MWLVANGARMVGFNSIGFDYPILHALCRMGQATARTLYDKAQAIIGAQDDDNRWMHRVKPTTGWTNLTCSDSPRTTGHGPGLKVLEFNMRSDNISDPPLPRGTMLTQDQCPCSRSTTGTMSQTKQFYHLAPIDQVP